jgi:hemoglobin
MAKVSLYERLGGYNAIAAVVDSMMSKLARDPRLAKYFAGHCEDSRRRLRQLQVEMICQATGGPCYYLGRDMKTVHKGLGIDGADWTAAISHLVGAMDALKVADEEQKEVLSLLNGIKNEILERP